MRKTLKTLLLTSTLIFGSLFTNCSTSKTFYYDNFKNPKDFYAVAKEEKSSYSDLLATAGAVIGVKADNEDEAALGTALATFGALKSNKEAAREGKAEVNFSQNLQSTPAITNATRVPEYNLVLLNQFYKDGHLLKRVHIDRLPPATRDELIAPIDGFQYLFTYNRKLDLDGDGFSFNEFMGVKRNFKKDEPLEVCVGLNESAMKIKKDENNLETFSERKLNNVNITLRLLNENNDLVGEKNYEDTFSDFNQNKLFFWNLKDLNLNPGFYILEADYNGNYDKKIDKRVFALGFWTGYIRIEDLLPMKIKTLRQFFQIHE